MTARTEAPGELDRMEQAAESALAGMNVQAAQVRRAGLSRVSGQSSIRLPGF